jgi:thiamine-monophosphate kinase
LHQPQPRVALGLALRGIASSAIDISDGLLADLGHILDASHAAAEIGMALLPVSSAMQPYAASPLGEQCALSGGDDYELCFTAGAARHAEIVGISTRLGLPLTRIGNIVAGSGCIVHDAAGNRLNLGSGGYEHFR